MDDEESEARFYSRTGDNERKAQGNFRREEVRCASGVACWGEMDYQHVLLNLADKQSCEIANVGEKFAEVRVPVSEEDAVDDWRYHPVRCVSQHVMGASCLYGSLQVRIRRYLYF